MIIDLSHYKGWYVAQFVLDSGVITYNAYTDTKPAKELHADSLQELKTMIDNQAATAW